VIAHAAAMKQVFLPVCLALAISLSGSDRPLQTTIAHAQAPAPATVRQFTFHYRFRLTGLRATENGRQDPLRVWLPCPPSDDCQQVARLPAIAPGEISEHVEPRFGNRMLFLQARIPPSGELIVDVPFEVTRREALQGPGQPRGESTIDAGTRELFLRADTLVPTSGKPLKLLDDVQLPSDRIALARRLYDLVDAHVAYKKIGVGWGRGDSNWVCDSGYGNCTDFHSLFMSLARSQGLPTRFEIGFSIPFDVASGPITGYHCWAWFHLDGRGWLPVDISEADKHPQMKDYYFGNLTADRVTFSVGRDLELVPPANQRHVNYFIYPHVEVGNQTFPAEKILLEFSFQEKQ
jgi:transglutaminase-like putative cysteine protease